MERKQLPKSRKSIAPCSTNPRRSTSRHTNSNDKKRMLKAARGKQQKGNSYERLSADFSVETLLVTSGMIYLKQ